MPVDEASLLRYAWTAHLVLDQAILASPRPPPTPPLEPLLDFQHAARQADAGTHTSFCILSQPSTAEVLSSAGEAALTRWAWPVHRRGQADKAPLASCSAPPQTRGSWQQRPLPGGPREPLRAQPRCSDGGHKGLVHQAMATEHPRLYQQHNPSRNQG